MWTLYSRNVNDILCGAVTLFFRYAMEDMYTYVCIHCTYAGLYVQVCVCIISDSCSRTS